MEPMRLLLIIALALAHGAPGPNDHHRRVPKAAPTRDVSAPAFDAYFGAFLSVNGLLGAIDQDGTTEGGASAAAARVMAPPEAGGKFFWLDSLLAGERKHRDGYLFDACMEYRLLAKRSGIPRSVSHAVHVRLGQATAMMFSSIEALKSYRGALSFDSESHVAYFHMGLMYARLNRIDEAVEAFRTAVFYRNDDVKSLHALGSLAFLRGREAEAKYFFKSALALDPEWTPANATSHDMKSADRGEHGGRGGDGVLQGAATIGTHVLSVFDAQEGSTSAATNRALAEYIVYEDDSSTTDTSDDSPLNSPPGSTRDSSPDSSPDSLALAEDEGRASWRGIHAMTVLRCAEAALHQGSSDMASKLLRRLQKLQEEGAVPSITFAAFPVLPSITALRNALVLPQVVSSMREHAALGAHIMAKLEDVQEAYFGGGQEIDVIDDLPLKVPFWSWAPMVFRVGISWPLCNDASGIHGGHGGVLTMVSSTFRLFSPQISLVHPIVAKAQAKRRSKEKKRRNRQTKSSSASATSATSATSRRNAAQRRTPTVLRVGMVVDSVTARRSVVRLAGLVTSLVSRGRTSLLVPGASRPSKVSLTTIYSVGQPAGLWKDRDYYWRDPADAHVPRKTTSEGHERMVDGFGGIVVHAGRQSGGSISLPFPRNLTACQTMIAERKFDVLLYMGPDVGELTYWLAHARLAPVQASYWMGQVTSGIEHTMDYLLTSATFLSLSGLTRGGDSAITDAKVETADAADAAMTEQRILLDGFGTYLLKPARVKPPYPYKFGKHLYLFEKRNYYLVPFDAHLVSPTMDDIIRRILDKDPLSQVLFLDRTDRVVAREVLINRILRGRAEMGGSRLRFVPRLSLNELDGLVAAVRVVLDVVPQYSPTSYAVATEALSLGTPVITMSGVHGKATCDESPDGTSAVPVAPSGNVVTALYAAMGMFPSWSTNESKAWPVQPGGVPPSVKPPIFEGESLKCCTASTVEEYVSLAVGLANHTDPAWSDAVRSTVAENYGALFENEAVVNDLDMFLRRVSTASRS